MWVHSLVGQIITVFVKSHRESWLSLLSDLKYNVELLGNKN